MEGETEVGGVDPGGEFTPWTHEVEGGPGCGDSGERGTQGFLMMQLEEEEEKQLGQTVVGAVAAQTEGQGAETAAEGSTEGCEALAETGVGERRPARGRGGGRHVELVGAENGGVAGSRGEEERGVVKREREHTVEDGGGARGDEGEGDPDCGDGGDGREHLEGEADSAQLVEEVGDLGSRS